MKFLCVPCDQPMKLDSTRGPDDGSMTLVYACEACGYEMAMLTNAHETQMVGSLGVKIGPEGQAQAGASKCPFTGMVQGAGDGRAPDAPRPAGDGVPWTNEAKERLESIPSFLRTMAKSGIEKYARDNGFDKVDESVLKQARSYFGM